MVRFDQKENTWSTSFRVIEGIIHVAGGDEYIPIFRLYNKHLYMLQYYHFIIIFIKLLEK